MPNERLELTFTGLCALVVTGSVGDPHPSSVQVLMVEPEGHHVHHPRMSFRGLDLGEVSSGEGDQVPLHITPDSQEIINLKIPSGAVVEVWWEAAAVDTEYAMTWDGSLTSMLKVPDLLDFNVTEVHRDGTNTAATVSRLPFGNFEARRIVRNRDAELLWSFPSLPPKVYTNQVALVSQAAMGTALLIRFDGKTYEFLSGDGESPLRIGLTNLPPTGQLVEPEIGEGESPPHLSSYRKIAKTETGTGFRVFSRSPGATRQGSICPVVRAHV